MQPGSDPSFKPPYPAASLPASNEPAEPWSTHSDRAIEQAIRRWNLQQVGWRGFEGQPWVRDLQRKYPDVAQLAQTCSSHDPKFRDDLVDLLGKIDDEDFPAVRDFFVGKLALEDLSCRLSGAAGGLCDKKGAYLQMFDMLNQAAAKRGHG